MVYSYSYWKVLALIPVIYIGVGVSQSSDTSFLERGRCPFVQLGPGFEAKKFEGVWYKIGGLPNSEETSATCTVYDYQERGNGFDVVASGLKRDGTPVTQTSRLSASQAGMANYTTPIQDFVAELVIVSTDYNSYACLFSCYNFQKTHRAKFAWILSRNNTLSKEETATCQRRLREVGVPIRNLRKTSQDGCTYPGLPTTA